MGEEEEEFTEAPLAPPRFPRSPLKVLSRLTLAAAGL